MSAPVGHESSSKFFLKRVVESESWFTFALLFRRRFGMVRRFFESGDAEKKKGKKSVARVKTCCTFAAPIRNAIGTKQKKSSLHIGLRKTRNAKNLVNYLESL